MKNKWLGAGLAAAIGAAMVSGGAWAQDAGTSSAAPGGFYIGAGGGFNWGQINQALQGISSVTNIYDENDNLVAQGQAGGPFFDYDRDTTAFAPTVQLGYVTPLGEGGWQAGIKFSYQYANLDSEEDVRIPQEGTVTEIGGGDPTPFVGFVPVSPAEVSLQHQFALMPTLGRSVGKFTFYGGAGPALFQIHSEFDNAIGYAFLNQQLVNVTGDPINFSNDNWVWGGAVQIGTTYALSPRWFLDLSYTFARSSEFTIENEAAFENTTGNRTSEGIGYLNSKEQVTNQSIMLTINRMF